MDNPLDLSEVFLRFRLRNPGLADNWMDVDISRCVKAESYGRDQVGHLTESAHRRKGG